MGFYTFNNNDEGVKRKRIDNYEDYNENSKRIKLENFQCKNRFQVVDGYVQVYTDGSCFFNGKPNARGGIGVWWADNNTLNVGLPLVGSKQSSAVAELAAVNKALEQASDATDEMGLKLEVNSDSKYISHCNRNIPGWRKRGWRTHQGQDVKNKQEIKKLSHNLRKLQQ